MAASVPPIRLKLIVDAPGKSTLHGLEKIVRPLKKELEGIDSTIEKTARRMQGFRMAGGKKDYTNLTDLLTVLEKIDKRMSGLGGKGFAGLNRSFKDLSTSLSGLGKQLTDILASVSALSGVGVSAGAGGGAGGAGGGKKPMPALNPGAAIQARIMDAIKRANPTGAMAANVAKNGDIMSLVAQMGGPAGARLAYNARSGAYRVSLPTVTGPANTAALQAMLAGAGFAAGSPQVLRQTAAGAQSRVPFTHSSGRSAYLYPDAETPYIRYREATAAKQGPLHGPGDDPSAIRAAWRYNETAQAQLTSRARAMGLIQQHGMMETGRTLSAGPAGVRTTISYANAQKETARLVEETGKINLKLKQTQPLIEKIGSRFAWVGKTLAKEVGNGIWKWMAHPLQQFTSMMLKLGGVMYTMRHLGRVMESIFITPIKRGLELIIDATEQYRTFQISVSGAAGGMGRSKVISEQLYAGSQNLPMSVADMQDVVRQMAFIPALSSRLGPANSEGSKDDIQEFSKLVSKLSVFDPVQGAQGVMIALREAFAGEFRSLKMRLEIDPALIAASVGKKESDLRGDPQLLMRALETFTSNVIPDSALKGLTGTFTQSMSKLRDALRHAAQTIGESGVFDKIVDGLQHITTRLRDYFGSAHWAVQAEAMSDRLGRILENVGQGVLKFLMAITGATSGPGIEKAGAEAIVSVLDKYESLSAKLPEFAKSLGETALAFSDVMMSVLRSLTDFISDVRETWGDGILSAQQGRRSNLGHFLGYSDATDLAVSKKQNSVRGAEGLLREMGLDVSLKSEPKYDRVNWLRGWTLGALAPKWADTKWEDRQRASLETTWDAGAGTLQGSGESQRLNAIIEQLQERPASKSGHMLWKEDAKQLMKNSGELEFIQMLVGRQRNSKLSGLMQQAGKEGWADDRLSKEAETLGFSTSDLRNYRSGGGDSSIPDHTLKWLNQYLPDWQSQLGEGDRAKFMKAGDAIRREDHGRYANSLFNPMNTANIAGDYNTENAFLKPYYTGLTGLKGTLNKAGEDPFAAAQRVRDSEIGLLDEVQSVIETLAKSMGGGTDAMWSFHDTLERQKRGLDESYQKSVADATLMLHENVARYGVVLSQAMDGVAPHVQQVLMNSIVSGTTDLGRVGGAWLKTDSVGGWDKMDADKRNALVSRMLSGGSGVAAQARYGGPLDVGMDANAIQAMVSQRPGGMSERKTKQMMLQYYGGRLPYAQGAIESAQQEYADSPTEGNLTRVGTSQQQFAEIATAIRDLQDELNVLLKSFVDFGNAVQDALENSIGDAIYGLITGTATLKDALRSFAQDVVRSFSQIAAQSMVRSVLGDGLGSIFGGFARGGGGGGNATGLFSGQSAGNASMGIGVKARADGGYLGGSFMPVRAFAQGGIVNRPMIGLIGEGGQNEAVVPLPDGRSIPVQMNGSNDSRVYVVNSRQEAMRHGYQPGRDEIIDLVASDIRRGGKTRKAMSRRVG